MIRSREGRTGLTVEQRKSEFNGPKRGDSRECQRCGNPHIYFEDKCLDCFEDMGGDGPGRDSMG